MAGVRRRLLRDIAPALSPRTPSLLLAVSPQEAFPTRIRSTAHGMSAASGKIGATIGSSVLLAVFNSYCTQVCACLPVGATRERRSHGFPAHRLQTNAGVSVSPPTCTVGSSVQSQIASGIVRGTRMQWGV